MPRLKNDPRPYQLRPHQTAHNRDQVCALACERSAFCRGLCKLHYRRWRSNEKRWRSYVIEQQGCWEWSGLNHSDKRPCFHWFDIETRERHKIHAFRAGMLLTEDPLFTTSLEAAHTCHNPMCVNPAHGVWATHEENMAMSRGENHWSTLDTASKQNHTLTKKRESKGFSGKKG